MALVLKRSFCGPAGRFLTVLSALVLLSSALFAQDPEPIPTPPSQGDVDKEVVNVDTDLVTLTLTVTDQYNRFVSGLTKESFSVWDEDEKQKITYFSDSDAPASVGILFDVSGSMSGAKIAKARNALERFINTSHPRDEYYLIAFNRRAQLLMDRTRDGDAVLNKLTLVEPKHNTALYDACYLGVERVSRGTHQKKALLIISDGQDNASRYTFKEVRRLMKESDVVIYSVGIMDARDSSTFDGMQGQSFLDELASVTGGKSFYPTSEVEMDEIFERIALELRHQYSIGYTPDNFNPNGDWRKVKVKVKRISSLGRLTVRYRSGYYATPKVK
ncbi:MAG: VWA domain-containing protein [Pyrinomonadaceae bacterium]